MRNKKIIGVNLRRSRRRSTHQGKILYRVKTRSGYMTVRSVRNIPEKTYESKHPSISKLTSNKNVGKRAYETGVNSSRKSTRVPTVPDTHLARLHEALLETSFKDLLKKKWKKSKSFSNTVADFVCYPFKVVSMRQLLNRSDYLETLTEEVLALPFDRLCNDLHEFHQTHDLFELADTSPALSSFLKLLKGPLLNWMQDVTGKKLSGKVTATGSKYSFTNYLLCHDDNLSDRSIAFILYLSKDWSKSDGGALELFKCNKQDQPETVVHCIVPAFGSFAFFEVTSRSYHQVQEIFSKDKIRLTINGWFHGDELPMKPQLEIDGPNFHPPISSKGRSVEKWVNPIYLVSQIRNDIKSGFCDDLSVVLPDFLVDSVYQDLQVALRKERVVWEKCGPAHQRNYEKAKLSTLPSIMQEFLHFLQSKCMFHYLSEVTVEIDPNSKPTPLWHLEVQRWSPGNYSLAVDNDPSSDITGIDVHLYFNVPDNINWGLTDENDCDATIGGTLCYLGPDKDSAGFLEQNTTVWPKENALFLVAHIAGMKRVTKYVDHGENLHFHKIIATYSQG